MDIQNITIKELNGTLESKLALLKVTKDREVAKVIKNDLNQILYSTIIYHAPSFNAVEIQTKADLSSECLNLPDYGRRHILTDYIEKATNQENLEGVTPFLFKMHLPFGHTTETHGSGQREADKFSYAKMTFVSPQIIKYAVSFLSLNLGRLFMDEVYFLSEEVDSIKLVQIQDSEFSQAYNGENQPLASSRTALEHYINFKGFISASGYNIHVPEDDSKEEIRILLKDMLIPEESVNLLKTAKEIGISLSGFACIRRNNEVEVFEFDKVELPSHILKYARGYYDYAMFVAYAIQLHQKDTQSNIKVYQNNDAIKRLHEFETSRVF